MDTYQIGATVSLSFPLIDLNGDPVVPTGVSYTVRDENGQILQPATAVTVAAGATVAAVSVAPSVNQAAGLRMVTVTFATAGGPITYEAAYILRDPVRLRVLQNSFQTFEQALYEASRLLRLDAFAAADPDDQKSALEEAYLRLTRLGYRLRKRDDDLFNRITWYVDETISPRRWLDMSEAEFNLLPIDFKKAIKRAQVLEANAILAVDPVADRRRFGIVSETIGESSMFFRNAKPLDLGLSAAALDALTGYVDIRMVTTRS